MALEYNQEEFAKLKAEYDALAIDDPKKAELHRDITTKVSSLVNAIPDAFGLQDDIVKQLASVGLGNEFRQGTPENTQVASKYEAAGFLTKKTDEAAAAGEEKLAAGRAALEAGVDTAKGELATGIETAKGELSTGFQEAKEGIAATKEEVTGTIAAGAEAMKSAGAETGTRLEDIGKEAGAGITAATAATGADIQARGEAAEAKMTDAWQGAEAKADEKLGAYSEAGKKAMGAYEGLMGLGGQSPAEVQAQLEKTPGYQFNLKEGLKATNRGAAARGGSLGGRALIELQERGAGIASNTFNTRVSQLSNMAGMGLQAGTTLSTVGQNVAQGVSGAAKTGLDAGMRGAEIAGAGAVSGIEVAAGGAKSGAMYTGETNQRAIATETQGTAGIQQWAGETGAKMSTAEAGTQADLTTRGATGAAATTMTGATGSAGNYQQAAGMAASLYGNLASQGSSMTADAGTRQATMEWQRLEADLARDMAEWQGGQALFGDLMSVGGSILGGPIGGGIASAIFG